MIMSLLKLSLNCYDLGKKMARPLRLEFAGTLYHVTSRIYRGHAYTGVRSLIYDDVSAKIIF